MKELAKNFCEAMLAAGVLRFGDFTLKSGRNSPYFFQLGEMFKNGQELTKLGGFYADAIVAKSLQNSFDVLFGAAYKGIPIVIATGIALTQRGYQKQVAFNRKEEKDHGEGGWVIGAELQGKRALIVDDLITDGSEKRNAARLVQRSGGTVSGVLIGLHRAETSLRCVDGTYYLDQIEDQQPIPLYSIAHLDDVIKLVRHSNQFGDETLHAMKSYRSALATN